MINGFSILPGIAGVLVAIAIVMLARGLVIIRQSEVMVIERLGSYHRTVESGINFVIPFFEQARPITMIRYEKRGDGYIARTSNETRIDRRETVMDFPGQPVVTTDNVTVTINGALYYQIVDPKNAVYEVENMSQAVEVLAKTALRSVVGQMELDKVTSERQQVNDSIMAAVDEPASKWGVKITRVEVQDIVIPEAIERAMQLQMTAERERRATVTKATGDKDAAIAKAEGDKRSTVLVAEADKEAAILRATGEKESIELVLSALEDSDVSKKEVLSYMLGKSYIEVLPDIAKEGERVLVPYEASALMGTLGGIHELTPAPNGSATGGILARGGFMAGAGA